MSFLNLEEQRGNMRSSVINALKSAFPVRGTSRSLFIDKAWIPEQQDPLDFAGQKKAKLSGKSFADPVFASLKLVDNRTGDVLDQEDKVKLGELPIMTPRGSFIVKGNEYQVTNQLRLKPGVYTQYGSDGVLSSQVNLAKGRGFKVWLDQSKGVFNVGIGTSNIKLYPILKDLGVSDGELSKSWGQELLEANRSAAKGVMDSEIQKLHKNLFYRETGEDRDKAIANVKEYFAKSTAIDPENTKFTLGSEHATVNPGLFVDVSKKLLGVSRDEVPEDDRNHMAFKSMHAVDDFLKERLAKTSKRTQYEIERGLNKPIRTKIAEMISKDTFGKNIEALFTRTQLSNSAEQINPLHMVAGLQKITVLGEGGVSERAITPEARGVHPSHLGMLDPLQTPESSGSVGAMFRLPMGARKKGNELQVVVYDAKTGQREQISAREASEKTIAFPGQYSLDKSGKMRPLTDTITVRNGDTTQEVASSKVDKILPTPSTMFGVSVNMMPFLDSTQGNRAVTASRMQEQALPLKHREEPLVQVSSGKGRTSFDEQLASQFAFNHLAPTDGKVKKVDADGVVHIAGTDGKTHKVSTYQDFPLNSGHFLNSIVHVKAGDSVKAKQVIGDTNFTKNGKLALGVNLTTAYIPYRGYNFEDGLVISESAAKKMTSLHMYKESVEANPGVIVNKDKLRARFPSEYTSEQLAKVDEDGVVKVGETVEEGDPLILALSENTARPEDGVLKDINKSLVKPYSNSSVIWSKSVRGIVKNVSKHGNTYDVYVETEEPAVVGDKLAGRHGNKGIISKILSDADMPKTGDDKPVDILMNPHGVPSRINLGQILETAVGKIAFKNGKPIVITNFERDSNIDRVKKMLADNGLKDTETLYDGADGKSLGEVAVGKQFIMKLDHNVAKKFSARDTGGYTADDIPGKGDHEGAQSIDPLLFYSVISHGAKANLHEMATVKSTRNDEFWRAYQLGQRLPAPKPTFAFEKFTSLMKGLGVDVVKKGNSLSLLPMTDGDVEKLSEGEITEPKLYKVVGTNDVKEEKNGFFDPRLTGGNSGNKWTHMVLHEPMPNPIFEDAIKTVLSLKKTEFEDVLSGSKGLSSAGEIVASDAPGALVGGSAFKRALGNINVAERVKTLRKDAVGTTGQKLNTFNKEIRYLEALHRNKLDPSVYVVSKIPVIPPKFRPIYQLPNGTLMTSDVNMFYKSTMAASQALKDHKDLGLPIKEIGEIRKNLYNEYKAMAGLGGESAAAQGARSPKGVIDIISGTNPKSGFFQRRLMSKRQDLTGRSTIINEPNMGVDEIGIPKKMMQTLFRKPLIKRLVSLGYTPLQAQKEIDKDSAVASKALALEAEYRPVMINRAPSLSRHSMVSFMGRQVSGTAIQMHPLAMKGMAADVDGDQQRHLLLTYLSDVAILEVSRQLGANFLKERAVAARFKSSVPTLPTKGEAYVFDLEDFPHGELSSEVDGANGKIRFFKAIQGTYVLAMDERSGGLVWSPVSHWSEHPNRLVEIVTLRSGRQIVTDDDPRAVYGAIPGSTVMARFRPKDAERLGVLVPRMSKISLPETTTHIDVPEQCRGAPNQCAYKMPARLRLSGDLGYAFGALAGNGWTSGGKQVCMAGGNEAVQDAAHAGLSSMVSKTLSYGVVTRGGPDESGSFGESVKRTYSSSVLAKYLLPLIGHGARNKHLPPFWVHAPKQFKLGVFAGLMDTDGSIFVAHAKGKRPQLMAAFSTTSTRLAQEVVLLAGSIGIAARMCSAKTPAGAQCWQVNFSNADVRNAWGGKYMVHAGKLGKLFSVGEIDRGKASARLDLVPMPAPVVAAAQSAMAAVPVASRDKKLHGSIASSLSAAKSSGYSSRKLADRVVAILGRKYLASTADTAQWVKIVDNREITWDQVTSYEKTGIRETGYDLTVPGYETFMAVDGVILSNTVAVHVPISDEAVREAHKMLPTQTLFNQGSGDLMLVPSQDSLLGLYKLTEPGKELKRSFKDFGAAHAAVMSGKLATNDIVKIGDKKTSVGRYTVNALLPASLQDYGMTLDKKRLSKLLGDTASVDPGNFGKIIDGLKDLGNEHAYRTGSTISLKDVTPQTAARDKIFKSIQSKVDYLDSRLAATKSEHERLDLLDQKAQLYYGITPAIEDAARSIDKDGNLFKMMASGARGNLAQIRQIVASPVMVNDTKGRPVPTPIKSSYAEGLTPAEYFIQSYGARMGTVDRSHQTSVPGYFAKRLINTMIGVTVTAPDCGTDDGVDVDLSAPGGDSKDAMDRYTALSKYGVQKNTLVTPQVIDAYKRGGAREIKVRSPMTCEAKEGVCSKCFGKREHGSDSAIGDNIGAISAQAITEPGTQLGMRSFHTGGVASGGIGANLKTGFARIIQMAELPATIRGSATLSEAAGLVRSIDVAPAGGWHVLVEGEEHYVPATNKVVVQVGDKVDKGQPLSSGDQNPHEILRLRGVKATQTFLAREIGAEYKNQGINLRPSIVETAVRQLTNLTRVTDPGDSDYAPGDYAPLSKVNAEIRGGANIQHEPELKGINQQPLFGNEDWLSQLNFQNLKRTIVNASSKGWSSSIHGTNPIAAWVYGAEFGKSKEPGRY